MLLPYHLILAVDPLVRINMVITSDPRKLLLIERIFATVFVLAEFDRNCRRIDVKHQTQ
jgi:hypothetical protein